MYYCSLIYKPCLDKHACFFISTATSWNCFASLEISLSYQAVYQYLLDCQGRAERERSGPEWKGFDNKSGGTTLASARALCLNQLSRVWLHISGGLNCCQESRRGVV